MQDPFCLKEFPSTRYNGSKRKIIPWIFDKIKHLEFETVLDCCGGSGMVSYLFKKMNKTVTYNDKLNFNYQIGKALIENDSIKFEYNDLVHILGKNDNSNNNFISETFENYYYTNEENIWLDNVLKNIHTLNGYPAKVTNYKRAIAFYALFQSCLRKRPFNLFHRKNLYLRLNNVKRNFGNKTTWERRFEIYFKEFIDELNDSIIYTGKKCTAINKNILDFDYTDYDLVYLDPPYLSLNSKNEPINYLKFYHFLEGLSIYPNWEDRIDKNSPILALKEAYYENEFSRKNISDSIEKIFQRFNKSVIVMSYKNGGIPAIEELVKLMKKYKSKVYFHSIHYKYALNRQNGDSKMNREVLIVGI